MNKLTTLRQSYSSTEIIEGSAFTYFLTFWLTKIFSYLQRKNKLLDALIHRTVRLIPKINFTIKNKTGIFAVEAFDDSTTICSDYFEQDIRSWLSTPTVKDIFIDIGANRGIYSIIAPTFYGYKHVHAFEPNPEVISILEKNITLNNLNDKVTIHNYGLGDISGEVSFVYDPLHKGGGQIINTEQTTNTMRVPIKVFDSAIPSSEAAKISFIKIDTEGFEFNVLSGMRTTLETMQTGSCIMVESSDVNKLTELLKKSNFEMINSINNDHLFIKI